MGRKLIWSEREQQIIKKVFGSLSSRAINGRPEAVLLVFDKKRIAQMVEADWLSFEWIKRKEVYEEFKNVNFKTGNTYQYIDSAKKKLGEQWYKWLLENKYLIELNDNKVITKRMWESEIVIANFLNNNNNKKNSFYDKQRVEDTIKLWEKENFKITPEQRFATHRAIKYKLSFINGNAGTGKTSVLKLIMFILNTLKVNITALSPTGKAAKRLAKVTGEEASTIHRALKIGSSDDNDDLDTKKLLENVPWDDGSEGLEEEIYEYAVIDEASMISLPLLAIMLRKGKFTNYIFIGDDKQLPPVQPGNFLDEIIRFEEFNSTTLSVVKRQTNDSNILKVATSIINNDVDSIGWDGKKDIEFIKSQDFEIDKIIDMFEEDYKMFGANEVVLLTPMKSRGYGTQVLNKLLRDRVNPPKSTKREIENFETIFRVGDVVMNTKNKYIEFEYIPNGETGIIKDAYKVGKRKVLKIDFDGKDIEISGRDIADIIHAYALTIHKSQGSEYQRVYLICHHEHNFMLKENLLYTGVTRAKDKLTVYGNKFIFKKASLTKDSKLRESTFLGIYKGDINEKN